MKATPLFFDENFKRGSERLLPILTAIIGDN